MHVLNRLFWKYSQIFHVLLSGNKTTCPEIGGVKVVFDSIVFLSGDKIYVIVSIVMD